MLYNENAFIEMYARCGGNTIILKLHFKNLSIEKRG